MNLSQEELDGIEADAAHCKPVRLLMESWDSCAECDLSNGEHETWPCHRRQLAHLAQEIRELQEENADLRLGRESHHLCEQLAESRIAELEAENARLQLDVKLAEAHDRQPYPTAHAYEQACKVMHAAKERVAELEAENERLRGTWHPFDRNDPRSWPAEGQLCWITIARTGGRQHQLAAEWVGSYASFVQPGAMLEVKWNAFVTHWMPITTPLPPSSESEK